MFVVLWAVEKWRFFVAVFAVVPHEFVDDLVSKQVVVKKKQM